MGKVSCIIPFYNEGDRIFSILDELSKIKSIDQIICVNDGSEDQTSELIKKFYKQITVIDSKWNEGKSSAVMKGLKKASGDYIFLVDADLQNFQAEEIEKAVRLTKEGAFDMVILKRNTDFLDEVFTRYGIVFSGERLLKREDLEKILELNPLGYQLEIAINKYMIDKHKKVSWLRVSAKNTFKIEKRGITLGVLHHFKMQQDMINYAGFPEYIKQILLFCRQPNN